MTIIMMGMVELVSQVGAGLLVGGVVPPGASVVVAVGPGAGAAWGVWAMIQGVFKKAPV
jgi:hypothetical protein